MHLQRLGPDRLGTILSVVAAEDLGADFHHARLGELGHLSHLTVEVRTRIVAEVS